MRRSGNPSHFLGSQTPSLSVELRRPFRKWTTLPDPSGTWRSALRDLESAPRQATQADAWLEIEPALSTALRGIAAGDEIIVITWLHRAKRDVLDVHPRGDPAVALAGAFGTRSPHRPNPAGAASGDGARDRSRLRVGPIEAIDGTPVVDVKIALDSFQDG